MYIDSLYPLTGDMLRDQPADAGQAFTVNELSLKMDYQWRNDGVAAASTVAGRRDH